MITWMIFGILLAYLGMSNRFWSLFGITYKSGDEWTDGRIGYTAGRIILAVAGGIIAAAEFPFYAEAVSNPGWTTMGVLLVGTCLTPYLWKQMMPTDPDDDWLGIMAFVRVVGMLLGILCLGIGIGTGAPSWLPVSQEAYDAYYQQQAQRTAEDARVNAIEAVIEAEKAAAAVEDQ